MKQKIVLLALGLCFLSSLSSEPVNTYQILVEKGLIKAGESPCLHLGCGEQRIQSYLNIDYPMSEREIHKKETADYYSDIRDLCFPKDSIFAIENHHIFEHFSRPTSLALLCAWAHWITKDGYIVIETPDFEGAIERFIHSNEFREKQVIIRHIFGSQEAFWAIHYDGWYEEKMCMILEHLGFEMESVEKSSYRSLDNIRFIARNVANFDLIDLKKRAKIFLTASMVDHSTSETAIYEQWAKEFDAALEKMVLTMPI